jgi:uncharacterized membrane protein
MRIKNLDLILAIAMALLNLVWATQTNHHPQVVGILLALPQVFFLPGYTLVEILFHRHPLENVRRFIFSLCLSIAIIILSGLLLSKSPWGLTTSSWAIYLATVTVLFSLVAMFMRADRRVTVIRRIQLLQLYRVSRKHSVSLVLIVIAIGLAVLSIMYSSYSVEHQRRPGFTQLWILQANPATKSCAVLIGVDSFEFTTMNYRVFMTTKGALTTTWSSPIILSPQKRWKLVHPIDVRGPGDIEVQLQLYQDKKPGEIYRYVHLTLHSAKGKSDQEWHCNT